MDKRLMSVIILVLILLVGCELFLPMVMSTAVNQGLMSLTGSNHVVAKLTKEPAVFMLGGHFDTLQINAQHAKIDKITFSEMNIALTDAQLDMAKLISNRVVDLKSVGDVDIIAVVGQDDLAQYLNTAVKGVKNATVVITPDKVKAGSNFAVGGIMNVAVTLEGRIVNDGQKVKFVTEQFTINNVVTGNIGGALLTEIPILDISKLPFHVNVRDIVLENGKITLYLDNRTH